MKKMRRIASILLAVVMVMAMNVSAFAAAGSSSIEITNVPSNSHTFTAYQIFDGDLDTSTGKLSNIVWGDGVSDGDAALTAVVALTVGTDTPFAACTSAADVAEVLAGASDDVVTAFAEVMANYTSTTTSGTTTISNPNTDGKYTYTISGVDAGYYLVTDSTTQTEGDSVSAYILYVAGDTNGIEFKNDVPTIDKVIVVGTTETNGTSASAGSTVSFKLTGTIPSADDLSEYTSYEYTFYDTLSANLTYVEGSLTVTTGTGATLIAGTDYTLTASASSKNIVVELEDALSLAGQTIIVTYNATLDDDAEAGTAETNKVYVEYSNNPYDSSTGKTTEKTVYVYTFDIIANKVDSSTQQALDGAAFTLYTSTDGGTTWNTVETISSGTTFTFENLGEGLYKLEETTVPDGYNKADDVIFTITADYDTDGQISDLTEDSGKFTISMTAGTLTSTIENKSGSVLPTTGGIGTTLFYIIGGILVVGAVVLLITRRRMKKAA